MHPVTGLALGRIGVGVASLLAPDLAAKTLGVTTSSPVLSQWFGAREVALGAASLLASGRGRRDLVLLGMAVDAADAVTAYAAVDRGSLPGPVGLGVVGVAAGAVVVGALGLRVRSRPVVVAA